MIVKHDSIGTLVVPELSEEKLFYVITSAGPMTANVRYVRRIKKN